MNYILIENFSKLITKIIFMKKVIFLLAIIISSVANSQTLYDINTIQDIRIYFQQANWDYQMDTAKNGSEGYLLADSVIINAITYDSVGVKYKGNSSYNANNNKNPLHIKLDYIHNKADYEGYNDIKLGNGYMDPSFIREALSYRILANYMDCSKNNFANVYINGTLRGLYSNSESIDKKFEGDHYYSSNGSSFKCNPVGGAGGGNQAYPDLKYLGTDSSLYFPRYEMQSDFGWNDLKNMIDTLNNFNAFFENNMDIDRALWMLAFNNVLINLDSYTGSLKQNYYLYKDLNNRFVPTVWDVNMSFGGFPGGQGAGGANMIPTYANDAAHPLIQKLLANAQFKKMYIAHMRTMTNENFANGNYLTDANSIMTIIDAAVNTDPYKFYTYAQFQNSLTTNVAGGGGGGGFSIPGIQLLMDARNLYLQGTTEFTQVPPVITNVTNLPAVVTYGSNVTITANVTNATIVYIGFRYDKTKRFFRVPMYDDGLHNDGAAGDNVFGASITANSGMIQYYIYAENANAGIFSPERAEHEFYTLTVQTTNAAMGEVVINEFLSNNSIQVDEYNEDDDWVELFNNSANLISLSNLYLSDSLGYLTKWQFPAEATINPNGFFIIWTDDDSAQVINHTNFKLEKSGGQLYLSNSQGTILDSISYGQQTQNISYGRYPNGTGAFQVMSTSFNTFNTQSAGVNETAISAIDLLVYPNPVNDVLYIQSGNNNSIKQIDVFDVSGKLIFSLNELTYSTTINTSNWAKGVYAVKIQNSNNQFLVKKIVK